MQSALACFNISIDGNVASAVYNSQLTESSIFWSFCTVNHIFCRLGSCTTTVTVEIGAQETFTCAIKLGMIFDSVSPDHPYDVVTGCDWFKLCSTVLENTNPDATVRFRLFLSNQWLVFAASPFNAIRTQLLPTITSKFIFLGRVSY
jgi:hypothetical protein